MIFDGNHSYPYFHLDLNGRDINRGLTETTSNGNVITVTYCSMHIKDSSTNEVSKQGHITGGYNSSDTGGGGVRIGADTFFLAEGRQYCRQ